MPEVIAACSKLARIVVRPMRLDDWSVSVAFMDKLRNPGISLSQRFLIRQKHDAEVLRSRLLAEAGAVDDHDVLLADEFFDEDFVALRNVDARESIECAAGGDAANARRGFAPFLR
jgi:hypothetical protein